jgi:hypothetical protein
VENVLCFPSFPWLYFRHLVAGLDDALLHLELESAVPHPFRFFLRKGWEGTNPDMQPFIGSAV